MLTCDPSLRQNMNRMCLPRALRQRIISYYEHMWNEYS
jgi:hypothetical protein